MLHGLEYTFLTPCSRSILAQVEAEADYLLRLGLCSRPCFARSGSQIHTSSGGNSRVRIESESICKKWSQEYEKTITMKLDAASLAFPLLEVYFAKSQNRKA